jgi:hypothetical protein
MTTHLCGMKVPRSAHHSALTTRRLAHDVTALRACYLPENRASQPYFILALFLFLPYSARMPEAFERSKGRPQGVFVYRKALRIET